MGSVVTCNVYNSLEAPILSVSSNDTITESEYSISRIESSNYDNILFASIYRRSQRLPSNSFGNSFCNIYPNFKNSIITGDLNCDLLTNNFEATYVRDTASSLSLHLIGPMPTHHTATSDSLLD